MDTDERLDAIVVGAGFGGLHMLYRLRERGFSARVLEMGTGVGGTWYWNRYPGSRVDLESVEYSYSFLPELEQEWNWTELMPAQPEILAYLEWIADRLDLRRDIRFSTRVVAATWNEQTATWTVETDAGEKLDARFLITATGCLSAPLEPAIAGVADFAGDVLHTNRYPKAGYDFEGKRVAVIGTGSSGVQAIPVIAEEAATLHVFQRSAAYTRPANNRPLRAGEMEELKAEYPEIRARQRTSHSGTLRFGAFAVDELYRTDRLILQTAEEDRLRILDDEGWTAPGTFADVMVDIDANRAANELYAELIRRTVSDPRTAAALVPQYPMGCKRPIIDTGYYETFNRENVTLVDLRADPLVGITATGIETESGHVEVDTIVFATGFDAITGPLDRIEIRGRGGRLLRDGWVDGPHTYLGLAVAGFPNLFTITGPLSPSVLANMVMAVEQHGDWITDCLAHMREHEYLTIEATPEAEEEWTRHTLEVAETVPVRVHESCGSWYLGSNVPGKKRVYLVYTGGMPAYRARCDEVASGGYTGFVLG
jgi:cation diffusion facilitator CzcD-associated flavoprotein CzcO